VYSNSFFKDQGQGHPSKEMALPFLFISFRNHQLPDYLAIEDK